MLAGLRLNRFTAAYDDEARFLMLAESLRFQGRYDLFDGSERFFPPGTSALFAVVMLLTGTGRPLHTAILPVKAAVLLLYLPALALLYGLLAGQAPQWVALATVAATAVNPLLTALAVEPMSDVPFVAASILSLWLLQRATAGASRGLALPLAAGLAAGLAWSIRLPGGVLVALGAIGFLFWRGSAGAISGRRRVAQAAVFVLAALLCLAPWWLYNRFDPVQRVEIPEIGSSHLEMLTAVDLYSPQAARATLSDIGGRIILNGHRYGLGLSLFLFGQPWRRLPLPGLVSWFGELDGLFSLILAGLIGLGLWEGWRRRGWLLLLYTAATQAVLGLWLYYQQRYILPLLPFYAFYLFLGLDWLYRRAATAAPRLSRAGLGLFLAGILAFPAAANLSTGLHLASLRRAPDIVAYYRGQSEQWANYFAAARWLAEQTAAAPTPTVVARKPYLLYLYFGLPTRAFPATADPAVWRSYLSAHNVQYVIEDAFTWSDVTDRFLRPVLDADSKAFVLVYETEPPTTRVWRFVGAASPAPSP
ncbi:MAG: glycosyltransferase family 39 protein [Caldilineales bacterium]|nr:glycosyltransferase family 39 protein [Caldilineales bacterium]